MTSGAFSGLARQSTHSLATVPLNDESIISSETQLTNTRSKILIDKFKMGGGGKIPYPKHVWSPAGGWYAQPANWRANTLIAGAVIFGIVAVTFNFSAEKEKRAHKPEAWESHLSRRWATQLINWDKEDKQAGKSNDA